MTKWIWYFSIKSVLMADLIIEGPIFSMLSALTGLPIK